MNASPEELARARDWAAVALGAAESSSLPFSFSFDGEPFAAFVARCRAACEEQTLENGDRRRTVRLLHPGGLEVRCEAVEFSGFPAAEWVLHLANTGSGDTPLIERVQALDAAIPAAGRLAVLHYARGALCCLDDFAPVARVLSPGASVRLHPGGGRSSSEVLPFFNLETAGEGVIAAVGWTGEWAFAVSREDDALRLEAGMAHTRFRLHAGEEVRSPRILLLFWQGERIRGHNLLRRLILARHRPARDGQPMTAPLCVNSWGGAPAARHLDAVARIAAADLPAEVYWIDAEWYGRGPWHLSPGDWRIKQELYPGGFRPISDALHAAGRRFLLWFEPERVCAGTPWDRELDGWLLGLHEERHYNWETDQADPAWTGAESVRNQIGEGDRLLDLGNPEARAFLTDFISERITTWGIDCYRHDANIAPLEFWRQADAKDRQGITEMKWVAGLYAFWDELLRRHPGLIIDNCASGGRRIDLETIGRSTALWRTDFPYDDIGKQCHTFGMLPWVPLHATGALYMAEATDYAFRSTMCSGITVELAAAPQAAVVDDFPLERARQMLERYMEIRTLYEGDFYPLTEYSLARDAWMAYQLDRPEPGEGLVVILKRPLSSLTGGLFALQGLAPDAVYRVTDLDSGETAEWTGKELQAPGLPVHLGGRPDSALIRYRRIDPA